MYFEEGHIYHIYNQGNNRQKIFFESDNYIFFLKKIKEYICPYSDILAWCLMPNHFHLMIMVKDGAPAPDTMTQSHRICNGIAILLRSYTRAINKKHNKSGSLFRPHTKAECITKIEHISPSFYNTNIGTIMNTNNTEREYPKICFDYIHQNPVKSGLVKIAEEWEFSSYRDYCGLREGKLVNKKLAREWGLV